MDPVQPAPPENGPSTDGPTDTWRTLDRLDEAGTPDVIAIGRRVAECLDVLHRRGVVHGDVSPRRIAICRETGAVRLLVADSAPSLAHRAPELHRSLGAAPDERADLYALGVTLYQLAAGAPPLSASDALGWAHAHMAIAPPPLDATRVPAPLARVILKLLAKAPDDRYQTARGLALDLDRCRAGLPFELGRDDVPSVLRVPPRLFGRDDELLALVRALATVTDNGALGVALVSGDAGIGKSSLVRAFERHDAVRGALWGAGRGDAQRRSEPYLVFHEALTQIVHQLLALADDDLARVRGELRVALGDGAGALGDIVADLDQLLGPLPVSPLLGAAETRPRLHYLVRGFLRVTSRVAPVVVFLDDLQAADDASIALLRHLVATSEASPILFLVALRESEIGPAHPAATALAELRARASIAFVLAPLPQDVVRLMVDDLFHCGPDRAAPLAALVHLKTMGNPFYGLQFIRAAVDHGLISFDVAGWTWRWDLERLAAERPADNVAELLAGRVRRLPRDAGVLLALAACLGHDIDAGRLARLSGRPEAVTRATLEGLVRSDLLVPATSRYRFAHDRIRDAAHDLLGAADRPAAHLAIGRDLLAATPPEALAGRAFEIAGHLEQAAGLVHDADERARGAGVFLVAARIARATAAFQAASTYCAEGLALLGEAAWPAHPELAFELTLLHARSAWPAGDFATSDRLVAALLGRVRARTQRVLVLRERIEMCVARVDVPGGIAAMLDGLRLFGMAARLTELRPNAETLMARNDALVQRLDGRSVEELGDLPMISDPDTLALIELLRTFTTVAYAMDRGVRDLFALELMDLTLTHGLSAAAPIAFAYYGVFVAERLGALDTGFRYAHLARSLVERPELRALRPRVLSACILVEGWTQPPSHIVTLARLGRQAALEQGDGVYATLNTMLLVFGGAERGMALVELLPDIEAGLVQAREIGFRFAVDTLVAARQWALALRGETERLARFDSPTFDESLFLDAVHAQGLVLVTLNVYHFALQLRFLGGELDRGWEMGLRLRALRDSAAVASPLVAWSSFFAALIAAARVGPASEADAQLAVVRDEAARLASLASRAERNFRSKHLIVSAELARLEGDQLAVLPRLEQAVDAARAAGFILDEAIALEIAARVATGQGLATAARAYLRAAYRAYARWGASAKLRLLEAEHPELSELRRPLTEDLGAALEAMMAMKATRAMSGTPAPDHLVRLLMRTILEYAGARRGHLVLARAGTFGIAARFDVAAASGEIDVRPGAPDDAIDPSEAPLSVLRYVFRTRAALHLGDAATDRRFAADPYIEARRPRSLLCVPIARADAVLGVLHVDNELVAGAFSAARVALVEHVAAQAAIAFENARLFAELRDAEERLRTLVAHAPIAIFATDAQGVLTLARGKALEAITTSPFDLVGKRLAEHFAHAAWLVHASDRALSGETTAASGPIGAVWLEAQTVPLFDGAGRVVGQTGIVVDVTARARMTEDLRALASELSSVEDAERRELARDLHDSVAQALPALKLELEKLAATRGEPALRALAHELGEVHQQVRTVMFELYPTMLDDLGLAPTLAHYARVLAGLEVSVNENGTRATLSPDRAAFLFRTAKELLRNVVKHAHARRAIVTLAWREGAVRLAVADDGIGFDPAQLVPPGSRRGFGLFDIRERVTHFGGRFRVESAGGAGAEVLVDLPLRSGEPLPPSRPVERPATKGETS